MPDIQTIANWATIIGLLIAVAALIFAGVQLRAASRATRAQLILALDEALRPYEDIRSKINTSLETDPDVRLRRYIARFERMGIFVETNQIDLKTINELYGGRIDKLLNYSTASELLEGDPTGWRGMIYLWWRLHEMTNKPRYKEHHTERGFPNPPVALSPSDRFKAWWNGINAQGEESGS